MAARMPNGCEVLHLEVVTASIGLFMLRIGVRHRQNRRHVAHAGGFIARTETIRDEKGNNTPHLTAVCMQCAEHWSVRVKAVTTHGFALLNVWEPLEGCFRRSESSKGCQSASVPSQCRTTEQKVNQLGAICFEIAATRDVGQDNVLKHEESYPERF